MSDFLTRLVTATYMSDATVRPRPVAHYEPLGAPLPLLVESEETPPAPPAAAPPRPAPVAPQNATPNAPSGAQPTPSHSFAAPTVRPAPQAPAPVAAPPKAAESLAARAQVVDRPAQLQPVAAPETSTPPPHPVAQPLRPAAISSSAPVQNTSIALQRPPRVQATVKSEDKPPVAPALAQGVAAPQPARVAVDITMAQPTPNLPRPGAPSSVTDPVSAPRLPIAAAHAAETPHVTPPLAQRAVHHDESTRVRPTAPASLRGRQSANEAPHSTPPAPSVVPPSAAVVAPVIRVTIGRIVIKAEGVKPPKPAKAHPTAKPGLSLDAYLKTRRGGDA